MNTEAISTFILLAMLTSLPASADQTRAPSGWTDTDTEKGRVLTKGTAEIVVGDWEPLDGNSVASLLESLERQVPQGSEFVSTKGVKPEGEDGAFTVTRRTRLNGKPGYAVLYGCPGNSGFVRIMSLSAEASKFGAILSGGRFIGDVCKTEPKSGAEKSKPLFSERSTESREVIRPPPSVESKSNGQPDRAGGIDLSRENAKIPARNHPISARTVLQQKWRGFPAQLTYRAEMFLEFSNGFSTSCTDWNIVSGAPTPSGDGAVDCEWSAGSSDGKMLNGFEPGERIHKSFGRIAVDSYDGISASSGALSGGDIIFTRDGHVAIGAFNAFTVNADSGSSGAAGGQRKRLMGRYYLNGHTATIISEGGDLFHTYIGWASDSGGSKIDHIHFAGEHYWDRDK